MSASTRTHDAADLVPDAVEIRGDRVEGIVVTREPSDDGVERAGWSLAAIASLFLTLQLWTGSTISPVFNLASLTLTLTALALGAAVWAAPARPGMLLQGGIMVLAGVSFVLWGTLSILQNPTYGTDAVAFGQYAAQLLLDGANPYEHSMLPSLDRYLVPPIYHTYLLDGGEVDAVSYPALSFLVYVPALLFGVEAQAALLTDLVLWVVALGLLWRFLPARYAWTAPILMVLPLYGFFVAGGVTDVVFVPFLVLALYRWDRFGSAEARGVWRWLGPVALGLAMCVKQTPWFVLPFLLIGLAWEGRQAGYALLRLPLRYAGIVGATFAIVNAPFAVTAPQAWLEGVLVPLTQPTVPGGQGLVNVSIFHQAGGNLSYYSLAGGLAVLLALSAYALYYRTLKRALIPLLALVFFWPTRSFASYLIDLLPVATLAAVTTARPWMEPRGLLRRVRPVVVGSLAVAAAAAVAAAVLVPPPLDVRVVDSRSTGQMQSVSRITVEVRNRTDESLRPVFSVVNGGYLTSFWRPKGAADELQVEIAPGATRRVVLRAPNEQSMPGLASGYTVQAFTNEPAAVSASETVAPTRTRVVLTPSAVNRPQPVGAPVRLTARLVDALGNPLERAGEPVALGQTVYGQYGLLAGESSIEGRPAGQSPVFKRTDDRGTATFRVRGVHAQGEPVMFQAWVAPERQMPTGYSNLVAVQFTRTFGQGGPR